MSMTFRTAKMLVVAYVVLSVLTLGAIVVLRNHPDLVTDAVWVRATIVVLSSLLTLLFTRQAAKGSRRGYLRLRLVSAIMLVAIVVIVALPGAFPVWLRLEQAVCGLLLLGVVIDINSSGVRAAFAAK
ncbi:hypothetical protein EV186_104154 [Labedaea rhizosphaerae]|uniref:Uncharacterized protein n=2 Tax=Labedaea rhizosphaerae TaxID=598644 RepID=A0A4R6S8G3_LABRH|nr:hypothetical protein EV186_104154 [Labedaea rhizosphaerae]